ASRSNYFVGSDQDAWHADVPQFASVQRQGVWQGVDLVLRSSSPNSRQFEFDLKVQPGADLSQIVLAPQGVDSYRLDQQGQLLLTVGGRDVVLGAPVMYQQAADGTTQAVEGRYALRQGGVGFEVTGPYDASRPLVVDPVLGFSSYLGGSGTDKA